MDKTKGFGYCGLACCICSENAACPGCRNAGCRDKDWCKSFGCAPKKGLAGCWACVDFPCDNPIFAKPRVRTFARLLDELGEEKFIAILTVNEEAGIVYHYPGQLVGDYDQPGTEDGIRKLVMGK
jgi:hypothetical protein